MITLYIDMDGTLAEYNQVPVKQLYEPNYFRNLKPINNVVKGLEIFMKKHPDIKIAILSCVLSDRPNTLKEKVSWLSEYAPHLEKVQKLFLPCGTDKNTVVSKNDVNFLLDDYSYNLINFDNNKNNHGIKLLNGSNGQGVKWLGNSIDSSLEPMEFADKLYQIISMVI